MEETPFTLKSKRFSSECGSSFSGEDTDIEIEINNSDLCECLIHNITLAQIAKLRKILIARIQTMAIEIVEVERNSSALPDETIIHRLSLLPIHCVGMEKFVNMDECECGDESGCTKCSIPFILDVTGKGTYRYMVTSDQIEFSRKNLEITASKIPIFFLRKGESVLIRGKIQKATGSIHSKWSPVTNSVVFSKVKNQSYRLSFEGIGQLNNVDVLKKALHILNQS